MKKLLLWDVFKEKVAKFNEFKDFRTKLYLTDYLFRLYLLFQ